MNMFVYEDISIAFDAIGEAYHKAQTEAGRNPEYWDTNESRRFRELLPNELAGKDEDKLRRAAVSFRKRPEGSGGWVDYKKNKKITGKKGGNGAGKHRKISKELEEHYASRHYAEIKDVIMSANGRQCVACSSPCEEGHHCRYDRIGTMEELNDVVPVCKKCHPEMDKLRKKNSPKR